MRNVSYLIIISILIFDCQQENDYFPSKSEELTEAEFNRYTSKLTNAYNDENQFQAGLQLANLKATSEEIYKCTYKGIQQDPNNCTIVFQYFSVYENFKNNFVKSDTIKFKALVKMCLKIKGEDSYDQYLQKKMESYNERIANREKLDSTKFNLELIDKLDAIFKDDQRLREILNRDDLDIDKRPKLLLEVKSLDSINLLKVENILENNGYPTKEQVGYDRLNIIWFVLHHQSDLEIRDKYQSLIEANSGPGAIEAYNWRSNNIREEAGYNSR